MPKAARRTSGPKEATKTGPYPSPSSRNSTSSNASSFLDIQLPGSDTHSVPVYDTCDEIRAKTSAFLESKHPIPGATTKNGKEKPYNKKVFCEHIGGVNSNSLRRFLEGEGEASGAENGAYYGAYCFFEKLRVFHGEEKSAARLAAEKAHPKGRPLHDPNRSHAGEASASGKKGGPLYITVGPGERPSDFLTGEEKGKYWFACEHSSGACARRKGLAREMGVLKRNMKGVK